LPFIFAFQPYTRVLLSRALGAAILWIDFTLIFGSLAFRWGGDPITIGVAMALYGVPGVVAGPWFGALADRMCPWRMLRWSYVFRAIAAVALWHAPTLGLFIGCILLKGIANLIPAPSEQRLFRDLLSDDELPANASRVTLIDQITKLIAPMVAAVLAGWHLPGFAISVALSVIGIVLISTGCNLQREHGRHTRKCVRPIWATFYETIRRSRLLRRVFAVATCQSFVLGLYDALLALFLQARGYPDGTFGAIVGCTAAGAMLAALVFKAVVRRFDSSTLLFAACVLFGFTVLTPAIAVYFGFSLSAWHMLVLWVGNGFGYGLGVMLLMITFQRECPREALGTVTATGRSLQLLLMILAPLLGGMLSHATSIEFVFLISGATSISLGLFAIWGPLTRSANVK
jgi:MFS family permease